MRAVKRSFRTAARKAGIEDFRFHDLRHCAATSLRRAGVDTVTAMKIVGHKSEKMHKRYNSVSETDLRHWNLYANDKSDAMLGYASEEIQLLGRLARLLSMRDGDVLEFEFRVQHRSGEWRWVGLRNVVFTRAEDGQPIKILGTAQDITDRKQSEQARLAGEQELRHSQQRWTVELERTVAERTQELIQSRTRLRALATQLTLVEQRERQRIAGELHDYLAQLLALGRIKLGQAKRDEMTARSRRFIEETDGMLAQALTYTRSLVAELSPPILHESGLAMAIKWLAEQMRRHELTVAVNCDVDLAWVSEDQSVLLFQSARELLINVSKYAGTPHASVSVWVKDEMLHLCIADEGVGFDPANTSANGKADRFGLFSIRERMEDLGGRMSILSTPGEGTRITLIIPKGAPSSKTDSFLPDRKRDLGRALVKSPMFDTAETGETLHGKPFSDSGETLVTRVLLVDDHAMLREGVRTVLEEFTDIEVVGEATNGEQALILARLHGPDVVVMDVNMPGVDGIEATRQLKKEMPGTIVIGLSVDNSKQVESVMRDAGAVAFLTKDVAIEQLHATIMQALRST